MSSIAGHKTYKLQHVKTFLFSVKRSLASSQSFSRSVHVTPVRCRTALRSLPDTPTTSTSMSSSRPGLSTYCGAPVSRRLINRYVNVDDDAPRPRQQQQQQVQARGWRDRQRPSTAPSEHPPPVTTSAATTTSLSVTRVQTVADPVERHRSFEVNSASSS